MNQRDFEKWVTRTQGLAETGLFWSGKHLAALVQWLGASSNDEGNDGPCRYTVIVTPFDRDLFEKLIMTNDHGYTLRYYVPKVDPYIEEMPLTLVGRSPKYDLPHYDAIAVDFDSPDLLADEDGGFSETGEGSVSEYVKTDPGRPADRLTIVSALERRKAERKAEAEKEHELQSRIAEYLDERERYFQSLPEWALKELWKEHEKEGFHSVEVEVLSDQLHGDRSEYDEFRGVLKTDKGEVGRILSFDEKEQNKNFHDLTVLPNKDTTKLVSDMGAESAVSYLVEEGGLVFEYQYCEGALVKRCYYRRVRSVESRIGVEPWDEGGLYLDFRLEVDR